MYQINFLDAATKDLSRLDKPNAQRILKRIRWLVENISSIKHQQLSGDFAGLYKLRVGNYRVIYEILYVEHIMIIHLIGHRREIYKR
ncbi:MAG: type II toxin-antitoxin system RelE/ParE family toxin [Chloroflexota bacterium]|nr:type II toxin-antitoxin system RelE/ParE family toxin [Chloroflexota bacterium]